MDSSLWDTQPPKHSFHYLPNLYHSKPHLPLHFPLCPALPSRHQSFFLNPLTNFPSNRTTTCPLWWKLLLLPHWSRHRQSPIEGSQVLFVHSRWSRISISAREWSMVHHFLGGMHICVNSVRKFHSTLFMVWEGSELTMVPLYVTPCLLRMPFRLE
jgi:hypothetical protein